MSLFLSFFLLINAIFISWRVQFKENSRERRVLTWWELRWHHIVFLDIVLVHQAHPKSTLQKASISKGEKNPFVKEDGQGKSEQVLLVLGCLVVEFFFSTKLDKLPVTKLTRIQYKLNWYQLNAWAAESFEAKYLN